MSTDRELLELAAKAAGIQLACWDEQSGQWVRVSDDPEKVRQAGGWGSALFDPLTDDGDALRLAVKLHISVLSNIVRVEANTIQLSLDRTYIHESTLNQDEGIATRRAIVRAAAEIGRSMP